MKRLPVFIICLVILSGCGGKYSKPGSDGGELSDPSKVMADAYLFDSKIKRDGKQNSFRLEIYQTDSVIALSGKGYFGKGALKGRLTPDSLLIYFPTLKEYLSEPIDDLFNSLNCSTSAPDIDLFKLFDVLPDELFDNSDAVVERVNDNDKKPEYKIHFQNCPWQIDVTYDWQDEKWRIRNFVFDDGGNFILKGKRREYRNEAKIKTNRFKIPVKAGSLRIIL